MEGDYRSRVDGIFKKFGKSPSSSQNSILKRSAVGNEEKRSQLQRTRRSQRSKKATTDVRDNFHTQLSLRYLVGAVLYDLYYNRAVLRAVADR